MPYRGKASNVREIGKALGVSTVLEGSVRRSRNRVRINVQLINAANDEHIWAEDYDRDLTDVLAIQSDLAKKITGELQAKLSPEEKAQMERKPTENGEAYLAFVQAQNLGCAVEDFDKLKQSEQLYERAVQLDPSFALAFARYSQLESWIVHNFDRTSERREKARTFAERALRLQPDLPEAHLAVGFSYYYGDNNVDAALIEFEIAQRGLPNESEVYLAIGAIQRRQGKWAESTANLEKAVNLNPKEIWPLQNLTFNVAEKAFEAVKSVPMSNEQKLNTASARADVFFLERKYREGLQAAESLPDDLLAGFSKGPGTKYYLVGFARKALHDEAGERAAFLKSKSLIEAQLKRSPDEAGLHVRLAKVLAYLGEKDSALAEAQRATELQPESKDAFGGPEITAEVAEVHAILGDNARVIEILDGLLGRPSGVTVQGLKINPIWDPLRNDSRFQALIDKYGAKA